MNKPKILIVVGNQAWCWRTSMENLAYYLPEFDIEIINCYEFKKMESYSEYVFIYLRGYASAFIDKNNEAKMEPFISTLTTGGARLVPRMKEMQKRAMQGWAIVVQNKTAYHKCLETGYKNVVIIPGGVNCNVFKPTETKPEILYVGMAGNMRDERADLKGKPLVEKASSQLTNDGIAYLETNIDKPLNYEQMAHWYKNLFIYAQPSDSEGCSNSVMEAMATGIPCLIVEGVGYHGEICLDGLKHESGQVVFVKRDVKDIKDRIKALMKDKEAYARISANAREFALQHDWKHAGLKYRNMFMEFLPIAEEIKKRKSRVISEKTYNINNNSDLAKAVDQIINLSQKKRTTLEVLNVLTVLGEMK